MHCACVVGKEGFKALGVKLPKGDNSSHAGVCVPSVDASFGIFGIDLFQVSCLSVCAHPGNNKQDMFAFGEKRRHEKEGKAVGAWTA